MKQLSVKIARKTQEAHDIVSLELVSADGSPLPAFTAGAHIDVHATTGIVRQYSLCNDPAETQRYLVSVLKDPASRGGSVAMHGLQEGSPLTISEPRNHFPLRPARRSLLLAGGIGITPIICMAEQLQREGANFELHYCNRSRERTAFQQRIAQSAYARNVHFHFDDGPPSQKLDADALFAQLEEGLHLFVCGPAGFIAHVLAKAKEHGWPEENLHLEYFAAQPQDTAGDAAFEIRLASSGHTYTIPADRSVVEVLADKGIELPTSCEQGVCGTCITRVIDGLPLHRDVYMTDAEHAMNDQFTPCCSRGRGLLVLDL
ncbi:PDR/VanB family oxidoreductase [Undibacterium sp.]|uniref:PDR/VanB family oxidoreductase n=1 Tax=Undibacterium sp. TaxID=1914977 RepID=UPI00374D62E3